MSTAQPKPELQPMAQAITAAMAKKNFTPSTLASALETSSVYHWMHGASRPSEPLRSRLIEMLELSPDDVPIGYTRRNPSQIKATKDDKIQRKRERDREHQRQKREAMRAAGPAERALVSWADNVPGPAPMKPKPATSPFSATMHADGTMRVTLDVTLPFAQATALMQMLLSANVLLETNEKGEQNQ